MISLFYGIAKTRALGSKPPQMEGHIMILHAWLTTTLYINEEHSFFGESLCLAGGFNNNVLVLLLLSTWMVHTCSCQCRLALRRLSHHIHFLKGSTYEKRQFAIKLAFGDKSSDHVMIRSLLRCRPLTTIAEITTARESRVIRVTEHTFGSAVDQIDNDRDIFLSDTCLIYHQDNKVLSLRHSV